MCIKCSACGIEKSEAPDSWPVLESGSILCPRCFLQWFEIFHSFEESALQILRDRLDDEKKEVDQQRRSQ